MGSNPISSFGTVHVPELNAISLTNRIIYFSHKNPRDKLLLWFILLLTNCAEASRLRYSAAWSMTNVKQTVMSFFCQQYAFEAVRIYWVPTVDIYMYI